MPDSTISWYEKEMILMSWDLIVKASRREHPFTTLLTTAETLALFILERSGMKTPMRTGAGQ